MKNVIVVIKPEGKMMAFEKLSVMLDTLKDEPDWPVKTMTEKRFNSILSIEGNGGFFKGYILKRLNVIT